MKGNISEELNDLTRKKISQKYNIVKIEKFLLPYENSQRSLLVITNKI